MSQARRLRRKLKMFDNTQAAKLITLFDGFAEKGYLMFDTEKYQIAMLQEFWEIYTGEKLLNLLSNMLFYCNIKNAYLDKKVDMNAVLLISIKDENDEVEPKYYYKNGTVALWQNATDYVDTLTV